MAVFKTQHTDKRELKLSNGFALMIFDRFTHLQQYVGEISVSLAGKPSVRPYLPFQKKEAATFLFFGLSNDTYTVQVRSNEDTFDRKPAYYFPVDLKIKVPRPHETWPAFPDATLADPDKPLDDPAQAAEYIDQRKRVTLQPTAAYPFPDGSTLVRGTVRASAGGAGVENAIVQRIPAGESADEQQQAKEDFDLEYRTAKDGQFVLFFRHAGGVAKNILIRAAHNQITKDQTVTIQRGMVTIAKDIIIAP